MGFVLLGKMNTTAQKQKGMAASDDGQQQKVKNALNNDKQSKAKSAYFDTNLRLENMKNDQGSSMISKLIHSFIWILASIETQI